MTGKRGLHVIVSDFFAIFFTTFAREIAGDGYTLVVQRVAKECVIERASGSRDLIGGETVEQYAICQV